MEEYASLLTIGGPMVEVAIFSLLMLLVLGSLVALFIGGLTPPGLRRERRRPGITSRGAMMLFFIDH
jgi:hypothetical protein